MADGTAGPVTMQAAMRAASVQLLGDYASSASVRLQVYPARPLSINPPCGFVDKLTETIDYVGITLRQRSPRAEIIVLHGLFDTADAASQRDTFVDGFLDWVTDRYHAAGANTTVAVVAVDDDPTYTPDWGPPDRQRTYYATRITLEGLALE